MKIDLICTDIKGHTWLIEHASVFNFLHKWLWNAFSSLYKHMDGDGIFKLRLMLNSLKWRKA